VILTNVDFMNKSNLHFEKRLREQFEILRFRSNRFETVSSRIFIEKPDNLPSLYSHNLTDQSSNQPDQDVILVFSAIFEKFYTYG
jgi:hypothetical protein